MFVLLALVFLVCQSGSSGSENIPTVGLIHRQNGAYEGYTLLDALRYPQTYLIDMNGFLVHSWKQNMIPGKSAYLLENGHLLRAGAVDSSQVERFQAGGYGGILEEKDWDGQVVWHWEFWSESYMQHHDFELLPNGNILFIAWELKTLEETIAAGRDTSLISRDELWPDMILEIRPIRPDSAELVWEWHIWDHLIQDFDTSKQNYGIVADHAELLDLNFVVDWGGRGRGTPDWNHTNSVDYSPELDQILLSLRHQGEFIVIDHGTTTAEAAGHSGGKYGRGGDILYRWGNPASYRAGKALDQVFFGQHDARWIEAEYPGGGNIMVFNNGRKKPESGYFSSVVEVSPPLRNDGLYEFRVGDSYGPEEAVWTFMTAKPSDMYSKYICGAERLPNGNTLICSGWQGLLIEIEHQNREVWRYVSPIGPEGAQAQFIDAARNHVFRASRYGVDYQAFDGRDLTRKGTIEHYHDQVNIVIQTIRAFPVDVYSNPFSREISISLGPTDFSFANVDFFAVSASDGLSQETIIDTSTGSQIYLSPYEFQAHRYFFQVRSNSSFP